MRFGINYGLTNGTKLGFSVLAPGAIVNDYVNALVAAGKLDKGAFVNGGAVIEAVVPFEVAAADDDGSIYRLLKDINPNLILISAEISNDTGMTSSSDWDLGIYLPLSEGGAVITKDVFLNGGDLSSAHVAGAGLNAISALDVANLGKMIFEQAGHTILTKKRGYDIALTANTVGSVAGSVSVRLRFIQG